MSDTPRQYKDAAGNPVTLGWLVRNEPEWAVNQIRHRDKLERELNDVKEQLANFEAQYCNAGESHAHTLEQLTKTENDRDKWKRCAEELTDCLASFGVNERSLETTSFVDVHSEEDISDKLSQALTTFTALKKETKE